MQTGERLHEWRKANDLSQEQAVTMVAKLGGVEVRQATWSRIEAGKSAPGLGLAVAIAKVTGGVIAAEDWPVKPSSRRPKRRPRPSPKSSRSGRAA
jgi:transcriptional regulator with XRE-family HTH domain